MMKNMELFNTVVSRLETESFLSGFNNSIYNRLLLNIL